MWAWLGNESADVSPWHVRRHDRWSWRSFVFGALIATCAIAVSQALSSVPGWVAPAIGAGLVAIALVVL